MFITSFPENEKRDVPPAGTSLSYYYYAGFRKKPNYSRTGQNRSPGHNKEVMPAAAEHPSSYYYYAGFWKFTNYFRTIQNQNRSAGQNDFTICPIKRTIKMIYYHHRRIAKMEGDEK